MTDYSALPEDFGSAAVPGPGGRLGTAIFEMVTAGASTGKAISLAALSIRESCVLWTQPRLPGMLYDVSCWGLRCPLTLEKPANTLPVGVVPMYRSAAQDADVVQYLTDRGVATLQGADMILTPAMMAGSLCGADSDEVARLFEFVIINRKARMLDNFSLGATMMYLALSPVGIAGGATAQCCQGTQQPNCEFPATWEDIFDLYMSSDAGNVMKHIRYLDPNCFAKFPGYPADHPNDDASNIRWLANHTGSIASATAYYGSGNNGYHGMLLRALNEAHVNGII